MSKLEKCWLNVILKLGSSSAGKHVDIAEKVLGTNTQNVYVNMGMRCFENIMAIPLVLVMCVVRIHFDLLVFGKNLSTSYNTC